MGFSMVFVMPVGLSLPACAQTGPGELSAAETGEEVLLKQIETQVAGGDFVNGLLAYMKFIDTHADSSHAVTAFMKLDEQKALANDGVVPAASVLELVENLPSMASMNTPFGRYVAFEGQLYKVELLKAAGDLESVQALCRAMRIELLQSLWASPDDPAVYHMANEAVRVSRMLGDEAVAATLAELETYVANQGPCIGSYSARVALIERYSKEEKWDARAAHFPAILRYAHSDYVNAALTAPSTLPSQKLAMLWTEGLAHMTTGRHEEALATFQTACAVPGRDNTNYREWAAFSIPKTMQLMHRSDPAVAIQAYEDYLQQPAMKKSGEEPEYANLARVEIGRLLMKQGALEEARPYFETARLDTNHQEVVTKAEESLAKLSSLCEASTSLEDKTSE
jgi:tetratricopeptide (TPR) repeat protein